MLRPTRFGIKSTVFYGLLWGAFYAAPYLNLFFLLLVFMTVFGGWGMFWAFRNMAGVRGLVLECEPMPAGSRGSLQVAITAPKKVWGLLVDLQIDGVWHYRLAHEVLIDCNDTMRGELPPLPRGIHRITKARIHSNHPFGTQRSLRSIEHAEEIVVYPCPTDLSAYRDRSHLMQSMGQGGEHMAERGPAGLREYKIGDELRDVHWKASARRMGLVVREYEGDSAPGLEVQLDLRCDDDVLEDSLSLFAALVIDACAHKELVTLITQDMSSTFGTGHGSFDDLWRYLACARPLPKDAPAPPAVAHGTLRMPLPESWRNRTSRSDGGRTIDEGADSSAASATLSNRTSRGDGGRTIGKDADSAAASATLSQQKPEVTV